MYILQRTFDPSGVNIEVCGSDVTPTRKFANLGIVWDQYTWSLMNISSDLSNRQYATEEYLQNSQIPQ